MFGIWRALLVFAFLLGSAFAVVAETPEEPPSFEPIELKPIDGMIFTESFHFESSLQVTDGSETPVTRILLRLLGRSDMSLEGGLIRERLEIEQSTVRSDVPVYDAEWNIDYTEEWMRVANGRVRLFHSMPLVPEPDKDRSAQAPPDDTLDMMSALMRGMDLLLPILLTPVLGDRPIEGGRPFPSNTREAQTRIDDWISPAVSYGTKLHGDNAAMDELALQAVMFGMLLQWKSDLAYRGIVTRDGVPYLRFSGEFKAILELPDTDTFFAMSTLEPMELLIDPKTGHEKYRALDYAILVFAEDLMMNVRFDRERDWKFPDSE